MLSYNWSLLFFVDFIFPFSICHWVVECLGITRKWWGMVAYSEMACIPSLLTCTSTHFPHYILGYFTLLILNLDWPNWLAWLIEWGGSKVLKLPKLGHRKSYSFFLDPLECSLLEHCAGTLGFHVKLSYSETVILERAQVSILMNSFGWVQAAFQLSQSRH